MITKLKEQVNKALSQSHGKSLTYDQLYTYRFSDTDHNDDRCPNYKTLPEFEEAFKAKIQAKVPNLLIYIQVDDSDIFKADIEELTGEDLAYWVDVKREETEGTYEPIIIEETNIFIGID